MPPKEKLTKNEILEAAVDIIKKDGAGALNARSLASALSCSTQPVFSNFSNMEELHSAVKDEVYKIYVTRTEEEIASGEYPMYKSTGMAYIRFAKDDPELFKLLFMCDRRAQESGWDEMSSDTVIPAVMKNLGITRQEAEMFQLEMWAFVHGIAVMFASSYFAPEWDTVSAMLTDAYTGLVSVYKERNNSL